jgi:hypothetical protein
MTLSGDKSPCHRDTPNRTMDWSLCRSIFRKPSARNVMILCVMSAVLAFAMFGSGFTGETRKRSLPEYIMSIGNQHLDENPGDIAVIIPWFQVVPFLRPLSNFYMAYHQLENAHIPVFIAELALDDKPFIFSHLPRVMQFRTNAALWHKESLLQQAVKHLPRQFTKVAFLDKDVMIDDPLWLQKTSKLLDSVDIAHPFETVCLRGLNMGCMRKQSCFVHMMNKGCNVTDNLMNDRPCGTQGFVLAVHRALVDTVGLFDTCVIGGGDTFFLYSCLNMPLETLPAMQRTYVDALSMPYEDYRQRLHHFYGRPIRMGFLPNVTVMHGYHGSISDKQYHPRKTILFASNFSLTDLYKNEDGMWAMHQPNKWRGAFTRYFRNRNEDATEGCIQPSVAPVKPVKPSKPVKPVKPSKPTTKPA